jgi:hypothetical protein
MKHLKKFNESVQGDISKEEVELVRDVVLEIPHEFDATYHDHYDTHFFNNIGTNVVFLPQHNKDGRSLLFLRVRQNFKSDDYRFKLENKFEKSKNWIIENILQRIRNMGFNAYYVIDYSSAYRGAPASIEMCALFFMGNKRYEFLDRYTKVD